MTCEQILTVIFAAMFVVGGIVTFFESRGGLVYINDLKQKFKEWVAE